MNQAQDDGLSALLDGELSDTRTRRCIEQVLGDRDLRDDWGRYHLIGDTMRGDFGGYPGDVLLDRVKAAIAEEPAVLAGRRAGRKANLRPLAGLALAATVAAVAILGVRGTNPGALGSGVRTAATESAPAGEADIALQTTVPDLGQRAGPRPRFWQVRPAGTSTAPMRWNDTRPEVAERLNAYLVTHSEYLASGVRGILPYARIVGYDSPE